MDDPLDDLSKQQQRLAEKLDLFERTELDSEEFLQRLGAVTAQLEEVGEARKQQLRRQRPPRNRILGAVAVGAGVLVGVGVVLGLISLWLLLLSVLLLGLGAYLVSGGAVRG